MTGNQTTADSVFPALSAEIEECALLLDVDGTIIDLAPTPREVFVPKELRHTLARLRARTGGAIAFVSGRPIKELDLLFAPLQLPAIGGHGAEIRASADGEIDVKRVGPLPSKIRQRLAAIAEAGPGILIEDKDYSLAIHFRLAPEQESHVRRAAAEICQDMGGNALELLMGKSVVEVKQVGFNKATAVRELMALKPYRGRRPIFIGDDTTDEPVFPAIVEFNGIGFSVGRRLKGVPGHFDKPHDVRQWLETLAVGTSP